MNPASNGPQGAALIYTRVSTRRQEEGASLETQEAACVAHAQQLGYTIGRVTREVYTGAELWDRPLLARDRADLKAGMFAALIFHDLDRLSRNPIHRAIILEECVRAGAEPFCVADPLDSSPEGMLIQYVKGYAAQIEREKIRERSMRGKHHRVLSGKLLRSGTDLYGYRRNDEGTRRDIVEPEAAVVRQVFHWFAIENLSLRHIARRLNEQGTPPPSAGKRTPYLRRTLSGQQWNHTQPRAMLAEPAYKGETIVSRWRGEGSRMVRRPQSEWVRLPDGTTPPIVSTELWDAAQRRLGDNRDRSTVRRNEVRPALLRGLISCGVCGLPVRPHTSGSDYPTYRCSCREHGPPCGAKPIAARDTIRATNRPRDAHGRFLPVDPDTRIQFAPEQGIESWVWERVAAVLRDPSIIARELQQREHEGPDPVLVSDLDTARRALQQLSRQQERLLRQFSQGEDDTFPWELVKDRISRLEREKGQHERVIAELERRLAEHERSRAQLASLTAYCERVGERLETFTFEEKRLALEALQVRVVASGRDWQLFGSFPIDQDGALTSSAILATSP